MRTHTMKVYCLQGMDKIQTNKLDNRGNIVTCNQFPDIFLIDFIYNFDNLFIVTATIYQMCKSSKVLMLLPIVVYIP